MAFLCAPSSITLSSSSSSSSTASTTQRPYTTFIAGSSLLKSKPSVRTSFSASCSRSFTVLSEKTDKKVVPHVPVDQRWMFEEFELNGPDIWNKTWYPKAADHVNTEKPWYVVDATDKILGRLASTIAIYIRGKNLATYTPSVDMGAFVIVVNAEKVAVSGKKRTQKLYRRHSGRPGGMKVETFDQLQQRIPERIIEHAVRGMLPKGRLGRALFNHLKVYKGPDHPHEAQKPIELPIRDKRIQIQK
ncbi:50S ribosomal protein L13, putative [Ricinus communis]|uniref:Large ribosomal subunit protein uL13c n=1 Tax=Ricinus communis TaxID=3988 RepID=B9T1K1_RICCO|nr:50S ribosomal protein L13, putative [Ricinus communis]|eukprot:XP_002532120.1 50S ribosomal protein L13, chloroplastic [Ricinus communis]